MILLINTLSIINGKEHCFEKEHISGSYLYRSYQLKCSGESTFIYQCLHGGSNHLIVILYTYFIEGCKYPQCVSTLYCTDDYELNMYIMGKYYIL